MSQTITITYRPLVKGDNYHSKTLSVTPDELYGINLMTKALSTDISIITDEPATDRSGTIYSAYFVNDKVSFDSIEVIQGALQVSLLFGIDPGTVITNITHSGKPTHIDFGKYFRIISLPNPSWNADGTVIGLSRIEPFLGPELFNSLQSSLTQCFPNVDIGVKVPSELFFITTDEGLTNVASSCIVDSYLPKNLEHYHGAYFISNVCTSPKYRGQGLSKSLLICMMNTLMNRGVDRFMLEVDVTNDVAYTLYLSLGFRKVDSVSDGDKTYDVLLFS